MTLKQFFKRELSALSMTGKERAFVITLVIMLSMLVGFIIIKVRNTPEEIWLEIPPAEEVAKLLEEEKKIETLTKRELEVVLLLKEGYSNAKIAEELFVSEGTVKKHLSNIFGKLQLYSRTEVLVFVERNIDKFQMALDSNEKC